MKMFSTALSPSDGEVRFDDDWRPRDDFCPCAELGRLPQGYGRRM